MGYCGKNFAAMHRTVFALAWLNVSGSSGLNSFMRPLSPAAHMSMSTSGGNVALFNKVRAAFSFNPANACRTISE